MSLGREPTVTAVAGLLALSMLAGCGTIAKGTTQIVQVTSSPPGARFVVSPSGQSGVTPTEVKLERRYDHTFTFSQPGYSTRKAYVRRTVADGPQYGNVASCLALPFICMAFGAWDEDSGGQFNLLPSPLHVELVPGTTAEFGTLETRVVFFSGSQAATVHFSVNGGDECALKPKQYATRVLPSGKHQIDAFHWDMFKMTGQTTLDIDGEEVFVAVFPTVYSTPAAFANELPAGFQESCIQSSSPTNAAETAAPAPAVPRSDLAN